MESKEPSEEKIIEAVKKYYVLKIDGGILRKEKFMHMKEQP